MDTATVPPREYKIVLAGAPETGKTSFLMRHRAGCFAPAYRPTTGVPDMVPLTFNTSRGPIVFKVWDLASECEDHYEGAHGLLAFYSLDQPRTGSWALNILESHPTLPAVLCGTKADLVLRHGAHHYPVPGTRYYELSAKINHNCDKPFLALARVLTGDPYLNFVGAPALASSEAACEGPAPRPRIYVVVWEGPSYVKKSQGLFSSLAKARQYVQDKTKGPFCVEHSIYSYVVDEPGTELYEQGPARLFSPSVPRPRATIAEKASSPGQQRAQANSPPNTADKPPSRCANSAGEAAGNSASSGATAGVSASVYTHERRLGWVHRGSHKASTAAPQRHCPSSRTPAAATSFRNSFQSTGSSRSHPT